MKASDIPTLPILKRLADLPSDQPWAEGSALECIGPHDQFLGLRFPKDFAERLIVAKMAALIRAGLVNGYAKFRMRGDFTLTDAGRAVLNSTTRATPATTPTP